MSSESANKALLTLTSNGEEQQIELPVLEGTMGPDVIQIAPLAKAGRFTFDPGFLATAACESSITFIDGDAGVLLHRGYPIEQLAEKSSFLETCYLLLYGDLPDDSQMHDFRETVRYHTMVHDQITDFFRGFRRDAHPMAILCGTVGALAAFYHDSLDIHNSHHREVSAFRLIAKMPTLAAMCYKYSLGQPFMYPDNELEYSANFLHMMFGTPCEKSRINPLHAKAMDLVFLLHADHEQNASTSTVRLAGSSQANPFAAIAAGIAALWGPAHGGANEAVLQMLREIGSEDNIPKALERARDKDDPFRLMGFGHRVYKNYDPRATVLAEVCHQLMDDLPEEDAELFRVAIRLEEIARKDDYFISHNLYPNVDFYSGIVLKALGIPESMFTVIFAVGRAVGWIAHWNEMISSDFRIGRPRQLYRGLTRREYPG